MSNCVLCVNPIPKIYPNVAKAEELQSRRSRNNGGLFPLVAPFNSELVSIQLSLLSWIGLHAFKLHPETDISVDDQNFGLHRHELSFTPFYAAALDNS
jgi:hypothetical protein